MKDRIKIKKEKFFRRKIRVRVKIKGTSQRPRLSVFRSNRHLYGQLIDDEKRATLASASDLEIKKITDSAGLKLKSKAEKKSDIAKEVGKILAQKALKIKIKKIVFDRGGYKFHGRVKQLAQGVKEGGLIF